MPIPTSRTKENGCIACGHCTAICPTGAITVEGREFSPDDLFDLPPKEEIASYDAIMNLFHYRRSIREFKDKPVEKELIEKVLAAAVTAPMGLPPSDVNVLALKSREKVFQFSKDYCEYLESLKWMVSPWGLGTCMLGGIHPFIQQGKAAKKFREKWGIRCKSKEGLFLIMGYPDGKYRHGIKRTFANIDHLN